MKIINRGERSVNNKSMKFNQELNILINIMITMSNRKSNYLII